MLGETQTQFNQYNQSMSTSFYSLITQATNGPTQYTPYYT